MKTKVLKSIEQNKLIAILRGIPKEKLISVAEALFSGGIRLLEITYSADGSISDEETARQIEELSLHFKDRMLIGAGTVLNKNQVRLTKSAGGLFIISPDTNEEVIKETVKSGLVSIPGALTPSEITLANRLGADFIKLFPISNLGVDYVKSIKAPLSHIKLLAVGGIDQNNIGDYLQSGVCGFGIGSGITDKKLINANDFEGITELARIYTEAVDIG